MLRIARMISATVEVEVVSTATETEALLLEANLIKRLRPRFNVLLRDDKSFPYILITGDHWAPQILKHRGARSREGSYFGPFASVWAVNRTITALQRAFLLRSCSDGFFESRTRPCLLYQIKRCSAPCTQEIDFAGYAELVREAKGFLSGKSQAVKEELAGEMEKASTELDFERAAIYRDRCNEAARNGTLTYSHILLEEVYEAMEEDDAEKLRAELIQVAAVTGVYGVSFVVVWVALSLVAAVRVLLARPTATLSLSPTWVTTPTVS